MTVREVSAYLHVHPSTICRFLKQNRIPAFRINGDWRFHVKAIDDWLAEMQASARGRSAWRKPKEKGRC
jgi:excisionase family DNA binding protein